MKKLMTLSLVAILAISCNAQDKKEGQIAENDKASRSEKPEGTWKVNKEVDENGNIIKYDSVYSWSSNNAIENGSMKDIDSLVRSFRSRFEKHFSAVNEKEISDIFENDSLFSKDFFDEDFFEGTMGDSISNMQEMKAYMETLRHKFIDSNRPISEDFK